MPFYHWINITSAIILATLLANHKFDPQGTCLMIPLRSRLVGNPFRTYSCLWGTIPIPHFFSPINVPTLNLWGFLKFILQLWGTRTPPTCYLAFPLYHLQYPTIKFTYKKVLGYFMSWQWEIIRTWKRRRRNKQWGRMLSIFWVTHERILDFQH